MSATIFADEIYQPALDTTVIYNISLESILDTEELVVSDLMQVQLYDVLGDILYSDIAVFINGFQIPVFIAEDRTMLSVEHLSYYGFDVYWDIDNQIIDVERNDFSLIIPLHTEESIMPAGMLRYHYSTSPIQVRFSGELVASYDMMGTTLIDITALGKYGTITWNNGTRQLVFQTFSTPLTSQTPPSEPMTTPVLESTLIPMQQLRQILTNSSVFRNANSDWFQIYCFDTVELEFSLVQPETVLHRVELIVSTMETSGMWIYMFPKSVEAYGSKPVITLFHNFDGNTVVFYVSTGEYIVNAASQVEDSNYRFFASSEISVTQSGTYVVDLMRNR
jgi:hypothetical protein